MSGTHTHASQGAGHERRLWAALVLTGTFLVAEVVGGILTRSLALISDAAHMLTDVAALAIALAAVRMTRRPRDLRRTFGYARFEVLAAAFNAQLLFVVALYILYEAWRRLREPPEIQSTGMLVVAGVGLLVNLASMRILQGARDESLNMKGAYLEVWSDTLGSLGVLAGALLIMWRGWTWVDPVVAVAIGLWVLPRTWVLLRDSLNVLLEGVPQGIRLQEIDAMLAGTPGVQAVRDLHVWSIGSNLPVLTAHVELTPDAAAGEVVPGLVTALRERFGISHATIAVGGEVPDHHAGIGHDEGDRGP